MLRKSNIITEFIKFDKKGKIRLIREFTELNAQRLNPDNAQMALAVDNPALSTNAFDKHEDAIRNGMAKLNGMMKSLSNTAAFQSLKAKLSLESQDITSVKVLRIVKSNSINYDVYLSFIIDNEEYWGVIKNVLSRDPDFKSEVFKDFDLLQTKEWVIKTKGLLIKYIKKWFNIDQGMYSLIGDDITCYSVETGKICKILKGTEIEVVRAYDNKIVIKYENDYFNLVNDNYVYFNYWFVKI